MANCIINSAMDSMTDSMIVYITDFTINYIIDYSINRGIDDMTDSVIGCMIYYYTKRKEALICRHLCTSNIYHII
jgi:hypothetical protein